MKLRLRFRARYGGQRALRCAIALAFAFASLFTANTFAQNAATPVTAQDYLAAARAAVHDAEAAHPGNSDELVAALILLAQRQTVSREITQETVDMSLRAVSMSEQLHGHDSTMRALALAGLAQLYRAMDRPEEGRPLAEEAFQIAQRTAPGSSSLAEVGDALNKICFAMGDNACALRAEEISVAAIRASPPKDELYLPSMLQDLAQIRMANKDMDGARLAMEEAAAIVTRQPTARPAMAVLESNAGLFYRLTGRPVEAEAHIARALELSTTLYGAGSAQVAHASWNLAELRASTGRFSDVWSLLDRSLEIYQRTFGPTSSVTSDLEASYASYRLANGQPHEAIVLADRSHESFRQHFALAVRVLPERQALALAPNGAEALNVALSGALASTQADVNAVYEEQVRSRALVTEEMAQRQRSLNRSDDPALAELLKQLEAERSKQFAANAANHATQPDAWNEATLRVEHLEREVAERSAAFRTGQRDRNVTVEQVRRALPADAVLISYVAYRREGPSTAAALRGNSYLAFVLRPGTTDVRIFDLGPAKPVKALVAAALASTDAEAHSGGLGSAQNERAFRAAGAALRKLVWDPLLPAIGRARMAIVVPDGVLNLLPFGSLPDGKGYLIQRRLIIHTVSSERDLLPADAPSAHGGLLAVGNPSFALGDPVPAATQTALRGAASPCESLQQIQFPDLPGSAAEVRELGASWKRWDPSLPEDLLTGANATRARFLQQIGGGHNRIVHLATHAFLLKSDCGHGNPLLNSGLVFAGANSDHVGGVLTAQQIASLDLSGLEWAVLSACNTGVGELRDGEGVLGLQRAFHVAGAHTVVMTLWSVDDEVTRRFMHQLYAQRLGQHASTAAAVWNSGRTLLAQRAAAGKSTHPWYWAGFVGSGAWN